MKLLGMCRAQGVLLEAARAVARRAPLMRAGEVHQTTSAGAVGWSPRWPERFVPMAAAGPWPEIPFVMHELAREHLSVEHVSIDWLTRPGELCMRPQGRVRAPSLLVVLGCGASLAPCFEDDGERVDAPERVEVCAGEMYLMAPGEQIGGARDLKLEPERRGYLHVWMRQLWPGGRR